MSKPEGERLRLLQNEVQQLDFLSEAQRFAKVKDLERKLKEEISSRSSPSSPSPSPSSSIAGRPHPSALITQRNKKGGGRGSNVVKSAEEDEEEEGIKRKGGKRVGLVNPLAQRPHSASLGKPRSNKAIGNSARRIERWVYIGTPLFVLLVGILGYFANAHYRATKQAVPFWRADVLQPIVWSPDLDVADKLVGEDKPILLTNTVVSEWPAFQKWTFEYFAEKNPLFDEIFRAKSPGFQHFTYDKPMEKFFGLAPKFQVFDAPARDFLKLFNTTSDYLYWSGSVNEIKLLDDIHPTGPLAIDKEPASINAWISSKGVTALLHYDLYYNCFVQIKGRKRFTLFPPSSYKNLYLHPLHHPAYRQSQVNLAEPDFKRFPLLRHAKPIEVMVEEGQVLFLPPLWFHQVEALDDSISANIWSHNEAIRDVDEIMYQPLPFSENWSQQKLYDAARVYITMLIEHYYGPSSAGDFVHSLLQTRFKTLDPELQKKFVGVKDQKYCSPALDESSLRAEMKRGIVGLRKFLDPVPKEVRMVSIEDYIQDLVVFAVGLERLPAYLEACFPV